MYYRVPDSVPEGEDGFAISFDDGTVKNVVEFKLDVKEQLFFLTPLFNDSRLSFINPATILLFLLLVGFIMYGVIKNGKK